MHIDFPPVPQLLLWLALLAALWHVERLTEWHAWTFVYALTVCVTAVVFARFVLHRKLTWALWVWQKLPEVPFLRSGDLLMAKAVGDVHRKHAGVSRVFVRIEDLMPIHAIDRGPALEKCERRAAHARAHRDSFLRRVDALSAKVLDAMPEWASIK